jgi:spermidine synthase
MLDRRLTGSKDRVLYHREGPTATVMVLERDKDRFMRINGRINASTGLKDMPTQVLLAQIPLAFAPRADDVFLLGYGSGVTAGAALQSQARRVTVVEIEPAVIDGSRHFDHVNHEPLSDPRLVLTRDDARHLLLASPDTYDVIISEPSHPWVAGVSNLFTRDFFRVAAGRLREDGVFAQWLQTYQLSRDTFRVLLATFQSVYPEVYVFGSAGTDCILLGSRRPLRIDLTELDRRWKEERVRSELDRVGVAGPEHLLADLYTGPEDVRDIVRDARLNTDDNMHVELTAPRDLIRTRNLDTREIFGLIARTPVERVLADPGDLLSSPARLAALVKGYASWGRKLEHDHYRALLVSMQRD